MPTYEYACSACYHNFEVEQKVSDKPLKKCPKCKKNKINRLITGTSFALKGEGWFKTSGSY